VIKIITKEQLKTIKNNKIDKNFVKWIDKNFEETDWDWTSEYDKSLTIEENKIHFLQNFKDYLKEDVKELMLAEETKADFEKQKAEEELEKEKEFKKTLKKEKEILKKWYKNTINLEESKAFYHINNFIKTSIKSDLSLIICSECGLGKTLNSLKILDKNKVDYEILSTASTHIHIIRFFYENRNKKVLLLDDTQGIFSNMKIISVLKQATWGNGEKKIIHKGTPDSRVKDIPEKFPFKPNLIILTNKIDNLKNPNTQAVLSRCIYTEIKISYTEKILMLEKVSKMTYKNLNENERKEIFDFIKQNTTEATEFDLRLLTKIYEIYLSNKDNWKELSKHLLKTDKKRELMLDLINSGKPISQQISEFKERAEELNLASSRRAYFRFKKGILT